MKATWQKVLNRNGGDKENHPTTLQKENKSLKESVAFYQRKSKEENKKFWNERRRNNRLQKASETRKIDLKRVKTDAY